MTQIIDNNFNGNLRGKNGAVLYFERTPYFLIEANHFTSNFVLAVVEKLPSLTEFVDKATGFRGVTGIGKELEETYLRMLPLIYSNLALSVSIS